MALKMKSFRGLIPVVVLLTVVLVSGCAPSPREQLADGIYQSLPDTASTGFATLDLREVVPGEWTEFWIACPGATDADLEQIGSSIAGADDLDEDFSSILVVGRGGRIVDWVDFDALAELQLCVGASVLERPVIGPIPRSGSALPLVSVDPGLDDDPIGFSRLPSYWRLNIETSTLVGN